MRRDLRRISEAAAAVKVTRQRMYTLVAEGKIPAYVVCGLRVVDMADVYRWASRRDRGLSDRGRARGPRDA